MDGAGREESGEPVPPEAREILDLVAELARRIIERKRREEQSIDACPSHGTHHTNHTQLV